MKKILLSLSALVILGLPELSAQIINSDFETWTTNALASPAKDPNTGNGSTGWWDFNVMNSSFLGNSPVTVFPDSVNPSPYHAKYCAKIVSNAMTSTSYNFLKTYGFPFPDTNGLIVTATINAGFTGATIKYGIPVSNRLASFNFYYRYIPNGSDTTSCSVVMFHYNSVTKKSNPIGAGLWKQYNKTTSWTMATVPIVYDSASTPDTAVIIFSACSLFKHPKVGDTLNIDYTNVILGINNISNSVSASLYPNPVGNELNIKVISPVIINHVEVYNITGELLGTYSMHNNFLKLNTQAFSNGLYFYKLYNNEGGLSDVGKFSVVK